MTTTTESVEADRALKAKHRAMWASGDYPAVAHDIIPGLGRVLVDACGIRSGDIVLDVAAGTGNAAIPAALAPPSPPATSRRPCSMPVEPSPARTASTSTGARRTPRHSPSRMRHSTS
jgi:hypothetical protein